MWGINKDYKKDIDQLKKDMQKLNKQLDKYKAENNKIIESYNEQFNTLFIDYDLKSKGLVKHFQDLSCELLSFFDKVCQKHDLGYWLDYGTLLGAYRHGTFIPWDDDLDVGMMAKDFIKFTDIINQEIKIHNLEDTIRFCPFKVERENFILPFHKLEVISDEGDLLAFLDIFPYDYARSKKLTEEEYLDKGMDFFMVLLKNQNVEEYLSQYYQENDLDLDDGRFIIPGLAAPRKSGKYENKLYFWKKEDMQPFEKITFHGKTFSCPKNYEHYLSTTYVEYKKIPKIIVNHELLEDMRNIPDIDETYMHYISKIKKAIE